MGDQERLWVPVTQERQRALLQLLRNLMFMLAVIWEELEIQPRAAQCERAVAAHARTNHQSVRSVASALAAAPVSVHG